jgi:hypothetical protein
MIRSKSFKVFSAACGGQRIILNTVVNEGKGKPHRCQISRRFQVALAALLLS